MKRYIRVRFFRGDTRYAAECYDLPVVTQALTLDALMSKVKEAIALQCEGEDPADFGLAQDASILASYENRKHMPKPRVLSGPDVVKILASFGLRSCRNGVAI
jgi:hypothetical protein